MCYKHEMIEIGSLEEKNHQYYRKCSNNFAADSTVCKIMQALEIIYVITVIVQSAAKLFEHLR